MLAHLGLVDFIPRYYYFDREDFLLHRDADKSTSRENSISIGRNFEQRSINLEYSQNVIH